ncbi:MAG: M23 family metallopeptidase [Firmicutes bacterium]|nr:M23 family metallopeptidase [Bacillota bacterium]
MKLFVLIGLLVILLFGGCTSKPLFPEAPFVEASYCHSPAPHTEPPKSLPETNHIKWVDFNVSYAVLAKAYQYDVSTYGKDVHLKMPELLAYISVKNGNFFSSKRDVKELDKIATRLKAGENLDEIMSGNKYYKYHLEVYQTIFAEFLGTTAEGKYGLIASHPIAKGRYYNHSNDFGVARSYGYKRRHLGHDLFGSVGTPIMAIEDGIITEIGWNRYGGWRVGIRSHDNKRYYYYAHLRKDSPFAQGLELGSEVTAGQHIGYLGVSGYSNKENKNMPNAKPHLHLGLQLIFHPSQEKGSKEIWIDIYAITRLLEKNRVAVGL